MPPHNKLPQLSSKFREDSDLDKHVTEYCAEISLVALPKEDREVITAKYFTPSLVGPALVCILDRWHGSIKSFSQLVDEFTIKFSTRKKFRLKIDHLFSVVKQENENLRSYVARFVDEQTKISNCIESIAVEAFRKMLNPLSRLYTMILDYEPQTFDEVLGMTNREIKLDEDLARIVALKERSFRKVNMPKPKKTKSRFDPYKKHDPLPTDNNSTEAS